MTLDVRLHHDTNRFFLYLPAPTAADGSPQCFATELTPSEAALWVMREKEELSCQMRARGIPVPVVPRQGWMRRLGRLLKYAFRCGIGSR